MASLSILNITEAVEREKFEEEDADFELSPQERLTEVAEEGGNLGNPKTKIKKKESNEGFHKYTAEVDSKTKEDTIIIYREGREPWERGYQKRNKFEFWIDENFERLFVFARKPVVKTFARRLNKKDILKCQSVHFDLSRLTELEEHSSTRGSWEDTEGIVTKEAKFGRAIDDALEEDDYERITAVHIDYNYGAELIHLILNHEGRISSQHNLDEEDLYAIYEEIKEIIHE